MTLPILEADGGADHHRSAGRRSPLSLSFEAFPTNASADAQKPDGELAINVAGVSKSYKLYRRAIDRLMELLTARPRHSERHTLLGVSLAVGRGEVVGVIGPNGAGKSTLLKIIAARLEPTSGRVEVNGSIAAILELGTGFHPELTGRENVYLGGLCLGLSRSRIDAEIDNIIAFAELEDVIDLPFRTYSSGMQARLTFATAVSVDPDILIIDEALSVGDNRFQLKSFNKIRSFKEAGKTILLVTHSMSSVTSFCDRAILLHKGRVLADGEPNWVTNVYHHLQFGELAVERALADQPRTERHSRAVGSVPVAGRDGPAPTSKPSTEPPQDDGSRTGIPELPLFALMTASRMAPAAADGALVAKGVKRGYRYGNGKAVISRTAIFDAEGNGPLIQLVSGRPCQLVMDCEVRTPIDELFVGFLVRDTRGEILFGMDSSTLSGGAKVALLNLGPGRRCRTILKTRMWLSNGTYFLTATLAERDMTKCDLWFDAYEFHVAGTETIHTNSVVNLQAEMAVFRV